MAVYGTGYERRKRLAWLWDKHGPTPWEFIGIAEDSNRRLLHAHMKYLSPPRGVVIYTTDKRLLRLGNWERREAALCGL